MTRNARLNPRSASGEVIPTTLNASALRDPEGNVIGAIGILRDMRELDKARAYAESLIKNAPDPVFVSDLEGKILQANDAVSQLLGLPPGRGGRAVALAVHQPRGDARVHRRLREVVERGVTRNARLNPRSASGEVIPTTLNASALRDPDGKVIGAIGILRDMRAYEKVVRDLEQSKAELQEKILDLEKFEEVVVGRELKMIALEKELESLQREVAKLKARELHELMAARAEALPPLADAEAFGRREPDPERLQQQVEDLELRVRRARSAAARLLHIMGDLNESNRRLADQRKAMLHILATTRRTAAAWPSRPSGSTTPGARSCTSSRTRTSPTSGSARQPQGDDPHHGRPARDDAGDASGASRSCATSRSSSCRPPSWRRWAS